MDFDEIMNTFSYNGESNDAIYLRTFPLLLKKLFDALTSKSTDWVNSDMEGYVKEIF